MVTIESIAFTYELHMMIFKKVDESNLAGLFIVHDKNM